MSEQGHAGAACLTANSGERPSSPLCLKIAAYLSTHTDALIVDDRCQVFFDTVGARVTARYFYKVVNILADSSKDSIQLVVDDAREEENMLRMTIRRRDGSDPAELVVLPYPANLQGGVTQRGGRYGWVLNQVVFRHWPSSRIRGHCEVADNRNGVNPRYVSDYLTRDGLTYAIIAVSTEHSQKTIDRIVTHGILWLQHCRETEGSSSIRGLIVIVPLGKSATVQVRMAWLDHEKADWELYEFDPVLGRLKRHRFDWSRGPVRLSPRGNGPSGPLWPVIGRFRTTSIERVKALLPEKCRRGLDILVLAWNRVRIHYEGMPVATAIFDPQEGMSDTPQHFLAVAGRKPSIGTTHEAKMALLDMVLRIDDLRRQPLSVFGAKLARQWFETCVLLNLSSINPTLREGVFHPRLVTIEGPGLVHRREGLGVYPDGRLFALSLSLKGDADFPMRAVEQWSRLFNLSLQNLFRLPRATAAEFVTPPTIYLVSPGSPEKAGDAQRCILGYLHPDVRWEIITVGEDWRESFRVTGRESSPRPDTLSQGDAMHVVAHTPSIDPCNSRESS